MKSSRNAVTSAVIASAIGIDVATSVRKTMSSTIERGEQAEQLLRSLLDGRELGVAVELDRHSGGLDRLANGVLHGDDGLAILVVDDPVELGLRVGDAAVVGEGVRRSNGSPTLVDARASSSGRLELRRLGASRSLPSIAALRSGVSSRSPSGAAKTRLSTPPCSDANSDSIRSVAFCVSEPGISNSSLQAAAERDDEDDERAR